MTKQEITKILEGLELEMKMHINGLHAHIMVYSTKYKGKEIEMHIETPVNKHGDLRLPNKRFFIFEGREYEEPHNIIEEIEDADKTS